MEGWKTLLIAIVAAIVIGGGGFFAIDSLRQPATGTPGLAIVDRQPAVPATVNLSAEPDAGASAAPNGAAAPSAAPAAAGGEAGTGQPDLGTAEVPAPPESQPAPAVEGSEELQQAPQTPVLAEPGDQPVVPGAAPAETAPAEQPPAQTP